MVYFDVFAGRKYRRAYAPLPFQQRLQLWTDRVDRNTRRFPRPRKLFLPQKFLKPLEVSSNEVEMDVAGTVTSGSRIIARSGG